MTIYLQFTTLAFAKRQANFSNPWVFKGQQATAQEIIQVVHVATLQQRVEASLGIFLMRLGDRNVAGNLKRFNRQIKRDYAQVRKQAEGLAVDVGGDRQAAQVLHTQDAFIKRNVR